LDTGTTANKLVLLDGSGNLPAVDASLLTGIVSATISASDPTISTNPSGGVGTEWNNSTSGAMFICTDATAGANVWTNVGAGSGNVKPYQFQGTQYGYHSGGHSFGDTINKFSFTVDGNATDVGNLTSSSTRGRGTKAELYGYRCGSNSSVTDRIDKHSYVSGGDATDVGNMYSGRGRCSSQSEASYGWISSGGDAPNTSNILEKHSFVSDGDAVDVADASYITEACGGTNSTTHGYIARGTGYTPSHTGALDYIQKFAFASTSNTTNVATCTTDASSFAGTSSLTHGYHHGGGVVDIIEKFQFSTDGNATDVGNLNTGLYALSGCCSTTHGYCTGGFSATNVIQKYSYTTDGNATDVGDLTGTNYGPAGHQY
jgi:hypothetical protein